jgi:hypothetical protein
MGEQLRREFPSTNSKARARHAAVPTNANVAEIRLRSRLGPQPFQSGTRLYSRQNFKLNRAAALAEWRGLFDA